MHWVTTYFVSAHEHQRISFSKLSFCRTMFEKNSGERKAYQQFLPQNVAQISNKYSLHRVNALYRFINEWQISWCMRITFMHTCVRYHENSRKRGIILIVSLYIFTMCKCQWLYSARIWHENKSAQNIEQCSLDIKVTNIYTYARHTHIRRLYRYL